MIARESEERRLLTEWQARAEKAEARVAELEGALLIAEEARDGAQASAEYAWAQLVELRTAAPSVSDAPVRCGECNACKKAEGRL